MTATAASSANIALRHGPDPRVPKMTQCAVQGLEQGRVRDGWPKPGPECLERERLSRLARLRARASDVHERLIAGQGLHAGRALQHEPVHLAPHAEAPHRPSMRAGAATDGGTPPKRPHMRNNLLQRSDHEADAPQSDLTQALGHSDHEHAPVPGG